jgi:hypothetical protein
MMCFYIHFCDSVWSFGLEANLCRFLLFLYIIIISTKRSTISHLKSIVNKKYYIHKKPTWQCMSLMLAVFYFVHLLKICGTQWPVDFFMDSEYNTQPHIYNVRYTYLSRENIINRHNRLLFCEKRSIML